VYNETFTSVVYDTFMSMMMSSFSCVSFVLCLEAVNFQGCLAGHDLGLKAEKLHLWSQVIYGLTILMLVKIGSCIVRNAVHSFQARAIILINISAACVSRFSNCVIKIWNFCSSS